MLHSRRPDEAPAARQRPLPGEGRLHCFFPRGASSKFALGVCSAQEAWNQQMHTSRRGESTKPGAAPANRAELRVGEQIARLFRCRPGMVWELIEAPSPRHADDVTLRDADGILVAYARPAER
jgi:hypothetical protein